MRLVVHILHAVFCAVMLLLRERAEVTKIYRSLIFSYLVIFGIKNLIKIEIFLNIISVISTSIQ